MIYYLVQKNPEKNDRLDRCWYRRETTNGEVRWYNRKGGFSPVHPTDQVLASQEVHGDPMGDDGWIQLEWYNTYLLCPDSNEGWLTPDGIFFGCEYGHHDEVARMVLKKSVYEIENTHVRIHGPKHAYHEPLRMTAEQLNWLASHGYQVPEEELPFKQYINPFAERDRTGD